jgi:hypothetical protein
MSDINLKLKIDNLKLLIDLEEENYKTAIQQKTEFVILQRMRENIKKLKADLDVLIDQFHVQKTGELPKKNDNNEKVDNGETK